MMADSDSRHFRGATLWAALAAILATVWPAPRPVGYWAMPGRLGVVAGAEAPPPSRRAYLTRAMVSLRSEEEKEWADRNRLTLAMDFSHNLQHIFVPSLYDEHPEFFPLVDGRRLRPEDGSHYWNPDLGRTDVAAFAAKSAEAYFAEDPAATSYSIGINDGYQFGESAETLRAIGPVRWFRDRPNFSGLVFGFADRVAADLRATHPDKFLGALAYYWCEEVPPFPVDPQVAPFLTADRAQGYDPIFRRDELILQERWGRAGPKRLGLYDYLYGSGYLVPRIFPHLLAENLRHARRVGFTDYFAEVDPNWGLDGPMPWLTAQLLQDPERSPEVLLDEYYTRYFRGAAMPMRRFFERCERQWMDQPGPAYWLKYYRDESQAGLYPPAVRRELRRWLDEAAEAVAHDSMAAARVALVSEAFGASERFVAMKEAGDALERTSLARSVAWRETAASLARYVRARDDFGYYTRRLRTNHPLAIAPFREEDYLTHDPTPMAVGSLYRAALAQGEISTAHEAVLALARPQLELWWRAARDDADGLAIEITRDGSLSGPIQPAHCVARLDYGLPAPAAWHSRAEPTQFLRAQWSDSPPRTLHLTGSRDSQIYQWAAYSGGGLSEAQLMLRGHFSSSSSASLVLSWLNGDRQPCGTKTIRLPEGDWPEWRTLSVVGPIPAGAAWVGVGLRVRNQAKGDWVEVREIHLRALR